jgi:hypothetical protein
MHEHVLNIAVALNRANTKTTPITGVHNEVEFNLTGLGNITIKRFSVLAKATSIGHRAVSLYNREFLSAGPRTISAAVRR